jgi:hypothetical protein
MGETALDEEIFNEYLAEMREHYTADKVSGEEQLLVSGLIMSHHSTIY